jgi:hypothetical protein
LSELIASGHSISDLVDARVFCPRGETASHRRAVSVSTACLGLAAWVESKYNHAEALKRKFLHDRDNQLALPTNGSSSSGKQPFVVFENKLQRELQIKRMDILLFVLSVGQDMRNTQQLQLRKSASALLHTEHGAVPASETMASLVPATPTSEAHHISFLLADRTTTCEPSTEESASFLKQWLLSSARNVSKLGQSQRQDSQLAAHADGHTVKLRQWRLPTASKLSGLLQSMLHSVEAPDSHFARQLFSATDLFAREMKAYCFGLPGHAADDAVERENVAALNATAPAGVNVSGNTAAATEMTAVSAESATVSPSEEMGNKPAKKRRIQPTLC